MNYRLFVQIMIVAAICLVLVTGLGGWLYPHYASDIGTGCLLAIVFVIMTGLPWMVPYTARPTGAAVAVLAGMLVRLFGIAVVFMVLRHREDTAVAPAMLALVACLVPVVTVEAALVARRFREREESPGE